METNPQRIDSIDIFRGLVILTMIFVNDVAGVAGVPWWMKHLPTEVDGMTFVDVVFPAFLFIVGMSIPLALEARRAREEPAAVRIFHILARTLGLLVVGVFMVNMGQYDPDMALLPRHLWKFLVYLCVILAWNQYPAGRWQWLKFAGFAGLVVLAALYRGKADGQPVWLRPQWWGILGLIGWAYLTGCAMYGMFRKHMEGVVGMVGLLTVLYIAKANGALSWVPKLFSQYLDLGSQIGGHGSVVVAGMAISMLFAPWSAVKTPRARVVWILTFAVGLTLAGVWLRPLYGIRKNLATPSWCLLCSAICCVIYIFLYWLVDLRGNRRWAAFVRPAGANPLLAYILPDTILALLGAVGLAWIWSLANEGAMGILRSAVFALAIVGLTGLLGRAGVRLKL